MLLNINHTADGEIQPYAYMFLAAMGDWMAVNAEAIHGARPWKVFGEWPSRNKSIGSKALKAVEYTAEDLRLTTKSDVLYAFVMNDLKARGGILIRSPSEITELCSGVIDKIKLQGGETSIRWETTPEGLKVHLPAVPPAPYASVVRTSK